MEADIPKGTTLLMVKKGIVIGTGSIVGNEIKRMFVVREEQGKGYGGMQLAEFERRASEAYSDVVLDASLGSYEMYRHLGYSLLEYIPMQLPAGEYLCYFRMSKNIASKAKYQITYDNRSFHPLSSSVAGEIDADTIFTYHQRDDIVWAEYCGGAIERGFLVGTADVNGVINFTCVHINRERDTRTGIRTSRPEMLPDGRMQLHEEWQWSDGDRSRGESILIERE